MYTITNLHIDYSVNLHYIQKVSNKYNLLGVIVNTHCTQ